MRARARSDFGPLAERYDDLRPLDGNWWRLFDELVSLADLRGRSVLDVGCGTGRLACELAARCECRVTGVDASPDMLAVAAERIPEEVSLVCASAEALPFADGSFERTVLWLVAHHLERPAAFRELLRVLAGGGRLAIVTGAFDNWSAAFFPSVTAIERDDGGPAVWTAELRDAGFVATAERRLELATSFTRADAIRRLCGRYTSSLLVLDDDELEAGIRRAEGELPERFVDRGMWTILLADARD